MRFNEFAPTTKNIATIKFEFEKILHALITKAKKQSQLQQSKQQIAKNQKHNNYIKSLKITAKPTNATLNNRPKRN